MRNNEKVFGAKAKVLIKSNMDLHGLANMLGDKIFQTKFWFKNTTSLPNDEIALAEAFGFEMWLAPYDEHHEYNYELQLETSHSHDELVNDRMHNLTPWLKRYLKEVVHLDVISP